MFEDPLLWLFVGPGVLLGLYAQARIKRSVAKYSQVPTPSGLTGAEVARRLLDAKGLHDVRIEPTEGELSDHYDPRNNILRLSQKIYFTPSIAAAGIAAHEAGHALQDARDYFPMELRTYVVPLVQLASKIAPWAFVAGLVLGMDWLTWTGVILFGSSFFFALVTLPVEFNASARAKELLANQGILGPEHIEDVDEVLDAAAWTYVSAAVSAVGVWLYYIFMLFSRGRGTSTAPR